MNQNIDISLLIQTLNERITQLNNDLIIKDTMIKQLSLELEKLSNVNVDKEQNND